MSHSAPITFVIVTLSHKDHYGPKALQSITPN